ncbi:hypothetical protein U2S91_16865 [Stenotrophomonas maltophilia]|nr:hypothetical protein [Stenotrophomonas maltophilia]WQI19802.1 hypothetical protein U2S91_16865 [Stenotrophomonas maltophilia]
MNTNKTLADVQPGGRVRLGGCNSLAERITDHLCNNEYDIGGRAELLSCVSEAIAADARERFEAWARLRGHTLTRAADGEYCFISVRNLWTQWQAALSAQPSPGGQDALRAPLPGVVGEVWRLVDSDGRQFGELYDSEWHASAAQLRYPGDRTGAPFTVQRLELIPARQPVGEHGEGDEFLAGICVALQCVTAQDSGVLWAEIVRAVGVDDMLQYATFIEPEEWDLAGFSTYASIELGRRKPRSKASKQAKRPPAQAVDLGQFRQPVQDWLDDAQASMEEHGDYDGVFGYAIEEGTRLLALIDSQAVGNGN